TTMESATKRDKSTLLTFDPDFAIFEELFFPDGNNFLEFVDRVMAGVEGCAPMSGCDDHSDAGLTDVELAQAVDHGNAVDIPGLPHEDSDLFELLQSHCLVGFIDQMQGTFAF